jgi:transcriptional regulator with XRE-family HTH domain
VPDSPEEPRSDSGETAPFGKLLDSLVPAVFESEAALARRIGVPQSTVSRWRRGATRPRVEQLLTLSEVSGISIDVLVRTAGYRSSSSNGRAGDRG